MSRVLRNVELEERRDQDDSGSINNVAGPRMICVSCGNDVLDITEDKSRFLRGVDDVMTIVAYLNRPPWKCSSIRMRHSNAFLLTTTDFFEVPKEQFQITP